MVWACRPNCTRECVACGRMCVYIFDLTCYLLSSKSVKEEKWQRDTGCPERRGPQRWYRHSSGQFIGRLREWGQLHLESLSIFWLLKIDNWIWSLTPSRSLSYSCLLVGPTTGRSPASISGYFRLGDSCFRTVVSCLLEVELMLQSSSSHKILWLLFWRNNMQISSFWRREK